MSGERDELIERLWERRLAQGVGAGDEPPNLDAAVAKLEDAIVGAPSSRVPKAKEYRPWLVAVVLVMVIGVVKYFAPEFKQQSVQGTRSYSTKMGQRANIILADGSKVTLGPATTLRVRSSASGGNDSEVAVEIDGEALFDINHNARYPFTVTAYGVTTRVLGTEFLVRAYDASYVRVAVREGKVSVQPPALTTSNAAIVTAGEAASVTQNLPPAVTPISDLATDFAWASGELVLRNVPLGEAIGRLSRWYNVKLQVADTSLLEARVSGTFPSAFSISKIQDLAQVMESRVVMSGNTLTFYKR